MKPHQAQVAFLRDPHRFVLACAGHQSGKTRSAAPKFAERVRRTYNRLLRQRPTAAIVANFWVVVPSYKLALMPYRYLRDVWPDGWSNKHGEVFLLCEPYPGCRVSIRSAEIPESLVSEDVDGVWVNEAARCKAEAWRGAVLMRLTATGGWCIADTTPMGQNWVYTDLYIPGLPPGHPEHDPARYSPHYWTHQWGTIALAEVKPEVAERVEERRRTMPAAYFAREFLADFSAFHGQVYPHFGKGCVRRIDANDYPELLFGVDWGYAPGHLGVVLVVGVDRAKRRAGVLEEVCAEGKTDDWWERELVRLMGKHPRLRDAYADPSAPDKIQFFRQRVRGQGPNGTRALRWYEADNSVREGIMCVAELIGTGGLMVNDGCPNTVRQMTSYHWLDGTERSGGEWQEKPAKVDDDTCDALRYALMGRFTRRGVSYA